MSENIKLKNEFFELAITKTFTAVMRKPFPIKTSYWLARIYDRIQKLGRVYFEQKNEIIKKYATKDEKGKTKTNGIGDVEFGKNHEVASAEFDELQSIEVDIGIQPIEIDFEACEKKGITLTAEEMAMLLPLMVEKELE